jgi:GAF domain-containing protein
LGERLQVVVAGGYVLTISLSGFLIGWQGAVVCGVLSLVSAAIVRVVEPLGGSSRAGSLVLVGGLVAATTLVVSVITRQTDRWQRSGERLSNDRASREDELQNLVASLRPALDLMRSATGIASQIGSLLSPDEIARCAVAFLCERLGAEWAGVFVCQQAEREGGDVDATEGWHFALAASDGDASVSLGVPEEELEPNVRELLARCMDSSGVQVAADGNPQESGQGWSLGRRWAGVQRRSILLVPLRVGEEGVGVLALSPRGSDTSSNAFLDAVRHVGEQISLALHRADIYARLQARVDESERLVRRYVEESWDGLVASQPHLSGYRYAPNRSYADGQAWLPPMTRAVEEGIPVVERSASESLLAVPLIQSGIIIGVIGLRRPGDQPWSEGEQLLVHAASEQVTQALENRRLFELAHDRAQRERLLRHVTERIRSQADLDGALCVATDQLRKITGATHVAIRLGGTDRADGDPSDGKPNA